MWGKAEREKREREKERKKESWIPSFSLLLCCCVLWARNKARNVIGSNSRPRAVWDCGGSVLWFVRDCVRRGGVFKVWVDRAMSVCTLDLQYLYSGTSLWTIYFLLLGFRCTITRPSVQLVSVHVRSCWFSTEISVSPRRHRASEIIMSILQGPSLSGIDIGEFFPAL